MGSLSRKVALSTGLFSQFHTRYFHQLSRSAILRMSLFFSYHTGSLAFGAAIIAVVKLIRITLEYIHKKLKGTLDVDFVLFLVLCKQSGKRNKVSFF